jgi:metal-responsive CopG/Arc/MetJ family transcriptional regulator
MAKNDRRIVAMIPNELYNEIETLAESTGQTVSAILRQMITMYVTTMKASVEILKNNDKLAEILNALKESKENE